MSETPPIAPPTPPAPPETPLVTPEVARPVAQTALAPVANALNQAMAAVGNAVTVAESWVDDFWEACGYDKTAVLDALTQLEALVATYEADYADDAQVLLDQAPAPVKEKAK